MARVVGYIAVSLDDFIATCDDSLDWRFKYEDMDLGEHDYRGQKNRGQTTVLC